MKTATVFTNFQFMVRSLVCDGASTNLELVKLCGLPNKALGMDTQGPDRLFVKCDFSTHLNCQIDDNKIFDIICLSHQVRLSSSYKLGLRYFHLLSGKIS